jgi:cyclase
MKHLRRMALGLVALIATVSLVTLSPRAMAQAPAEAVSAATLDSAGLTLTKLGEGIYGLIASTDFPPTNPDLAICNGGIVIGSDGVLVVDPFQNETLGNLLFDTVATLTDQPVKYVVNTHYHFDHTGGNPAAASREVPILGRGPIREWMLSRNAETDPNLTPPEVIIDGSWDLWLGDGQGPAQGQRTVEIREFDGHTGGTDLIAYVPDADVLIAGDLLFNQRIPYLADGNIRVLQATLDQLIADYPTAAVLPGHGPVAETVAAIADLRAFLDDLEALALEWKAADTSKEEALATSLPDPQYSDFLFQGLFPISLEVAYNQITLGEDDAASIQQYLATQPEVLKAL